VTSRTSATTLSALILGVAVILSGCTEAAPSGAAAGPAAPPATTAGNGCSEAPAAVEEHLNSSDVASVVVEGQCTSIVITTELADDDVATGRRLCDTAGEVAYTGDINGVRVLSASGQELSVGITGAKCLP
jgi:hypothetical protein